MICLDLTNEDSFKTVKQWSESISENCVVADIPVVLVGCKADLEDERQITGEQVSQLAQECNMPYFETSSKNGIGVNEPF